MTSKKSTSSRKNPILWATSGVLFLALLFAREVYPEFLWLTLAIGIAFIGTLAGLLAENRKALLGRSAAYGFNSGITVLLVIAIIGVVNFLSARYPYKFDTTKNKVHTLSDQTEKLVKHLKSPVKATLFAKFSQREVSRPLFDNYKALNPKFEVEYVDPDREPIRTKEAGIKKYGTVLLQSGTREAKVDDANEEKLTNALIKLLKDKTPTLCSITGHGERSLNSVEADGYSAVKKSLADQSYETKEINLAIDKKIPDGCDAIAILGANKGLAAPEIDAIKEYLNNGGHAIISLEVNLKGQDVSPEMTQLVQDWGVLPINDLVVDPISRALNQDASVPIIVTYSKESPITKDFQTNCLFPISRSLESVPNGPASLKVQWLAQTNPKSWGIMDLTTIAKGAIAYNEKKDKSGPLTLAMSVDGKKADSKATRNSRIVVFGSVSFANNQFSRLGGNLDLFMNSVSWIMEDESMISIRAKDDTAGKVDMTQKQATVIGIMTLFVIPFLIAVAGIVIWVVRKKL